MAWHNDDMRDKDFPDLTQIPSGNDICLFTGFTDLRMSVDGLASKMMFEYRTDTAGKTMLFCGRKADRIKILYRTAAGYALLYHRYEDTKLIWPRSPEEVWIISPKQMMMLLNGYPVHREEAISYLQRISM